MSRHSTEVTLLTHSNHWSALLRTIFSFSNPNYSIFKESPDVFCSLVVTVGCKMMPGKFHQIMSVSDWYWFFPTGTNLPDYGLREGGKMCTERKNKGGQAVLNLYTLDQWVGGKVQRVRFITLSQLRKTNTLKRRSTMLWGCEEAFIWDIQGI